MILINALETLGLPPALLPKIPVNTSEKSFLPPELPLLDPSYRLTAIQPSSLPGQSKFIFENNGSVVEFELSIPLGNGPEMSEVHRQRRWPFVSTPTVASFMDGLLQDHIAGFDFVIVRALSLLNILTLNRVMILL